MRRFLIIFIMVLLAVFVALLAYIFFFSDDKSLSSIESFFFDQENFIRSTEPQSTNPAGENLNIVDQKTAAFAVNSTTVVSINTSGELNYYDPSASASPTTTSLMTSETLAKTLVDPVKNQILFTTKDDSAWNLALLETGIIESLSPNIKNVSFSPTGEIARVEVASNGVATVVLQNGNTTRTVYSAPVADLTAQWVNSRTLALSTTPSGAASSFLYLLDTVTRSVSRVVGNRYGLSALVSPDRNWAILAQTDSGGKNLNVSKLNIRTREEQALSVSTLPEKCVFSTARPETVYCATFGTNPRSQTMPEDYQMGVFLNSATNIVQINLATGDIQTIGQNITIDPVSPKLPADEDFIYFIDKSTGTLYSLRLD